MTVARHDEATSSTQHQPHGPAQCGDNSESSCVFIVRWQLLWESETLKSIAIIGTGCSGLAAAHILRDAGNAVTVLERSNGVGGRAATRRRQGFIYEHGVTF